MIISIDFDGVIARTNYPMINGEYPYAAESMQKLRDAGHYLIVNTCREGEHLLAAVNWMATNGIVYDRINDNYPANIEMYNCNSRKIYAHVYIDDKNLGGFPGWLLAIDMIRDLENEYQLKQQRS